MRNDGTPYPLLLRHLADQLDVVVEEQMDHDELQFVRDEESTRAVQALVYVYMSVE